MELKVNGHFYVFLSLLFTAPGYALTLVGEQFTCDGYSTEYNCSGYNLANATASLPPNTTVYHYTALELIVNLNTTDFSHLAFLETLQLSPKWDLRLHMHIDEVTHDDIFATLKNLKVLKINIKWFMNIPLPNLFTPLNNLEELDLANTQRLDINNLLDSFEGLRNKGHLKSLNLWNIQRLEHAQTFLYLNLSVMLEPLQNSPIRYLNLGYNGFRYMFPGLIAFTPLLEHLVLSNNILMPLVTSSLFLEVLMHPSLQRVEMGEQGFRPPGIMNSPHKSFARSLSRAKIQGRKTSEERVTHPALIWQSDPVLPKLAETQELKGFSITNSLPEIELYDVVGIAGQNKCMFLELEYADYIKMFTHNHTLFCHFLYEYEYRTFGGIPCSAIPGIMEMVNETCTGCMVIPLGPNLQTIVMNQLNVYDEVEIYLDYQNGTQCFQSNNTLLEIDVSSNFEYGFIGISALVRTEAKGLEKLKTLDVSDSGVEALNPFLFKSFPDLQVLNLSRNLLTFTEDYDEDLFRHNEQLQEIDVSSNKIKKFPSEQFSSLTNLKILNASHNELEEFNIEIGLLHNLEYIDVSFNALQGLHRNFTDQLATLTRNNQMIMFDLSENNLVCTCSNLEFIKWLVGNPKNIQFRNYATYSCLDKNSNRILIEKLDMSAIQEDCNKIRNIILASVFGTILFVLLIAGITVGYLKRWRIRYYIYVA